MKLLKLQTSRVMLAHAMLSGALLCLQVHAESALDLRLLPTENPLVIDVNDASQRALKHNIDLQIGKQHVVIAESETLLSTSKLLPKVTANGNYTATENDLNSVLQESASAQLKMSIPLLDAKGIVDIKAKREFAAAAKDRSAADEDAMINSVMSTYIDALIARGMMDNAVLEREQYKKEHSVYEQRARVGSARALDVTRAKYLVEKAHSEYLLKAQDFQKRMGELGKKIGVREFFRLSLFEITSPYLSKSRDELAEIASNATDLVAVRRELSASRFAVVSEKFDFFPRLFATVDSGWSTPYDRGILATAPLSVKMMINLEIPLFSGGATFAAIQNRHASRVINELTLSSKTTDKLLTINGLLEQIKDYVNVRTSSELALDAATKSQQSAERLYDKGEITGLELVEANTNLFNARNQMVIATLRLEQAKLKLLFTIGKAKEITTISKVEQS